MAGRRLLLAAIIMSAVVGISAVAVASIPSSGGVISGCASKRDGSLRVIDAESGATCNASREIALTWSQQGPAGPPGPAGPQGQPGPDAYFAGNLTGADLHQMDLSLRYFARATAIGVNFSLSNLSRSDFSGAYLQQTNFQGANLEYATLADANLSSVNMRSANLRFARLGYASFGHGTDLSNADLSGASFNNAYMVGSNFSYANFTNVNMSNAVFNADYPPTVTGIIYSNTTCPDGSISDLNAGSTCSGHGMP